MKLEGYVGVHSKGVVVVNNIKWEIVLALFIGLHLSVFLDLELPSV